EHAAGLDDRRLQLALAHPPAHRYVPLPAGASSSHGPSYVSPFSVATQTLRPLRYSPFHSIRPLSQSQNNVSEIGSAVREHRRASGARSSLENGGARHLS